MNDPYTKPIAVFDLDGTLADTIGDLVAAVNKIIVPNGLQPIEGEQNGHLVAQGLRPLIKRAYEISDIELGDKLLDEIFEQCVDEYDKDICRLTRYYPGVETCLEKLSTEGWLLAVCTNKPFYLAQKLLKKLGHHHLFAAITGSDTYPYRKPDPRHLLNTIEVAGGKSSKAVMIGDTQTDILTARNADICVIAVDFGYSDVPVSQLHPDKIISHFDALAETAENLVRKIS